MKFQIRQRAGETVDIVTMRAYAAALPELDDNALRAMVGWIRDHAAAELLARRSSRLTSEEIGRLYPVHVAGRE